MRKIIILNGPPGCGKDTLCKKFIDHLPYSGTGFEAVKGSFAMPLKAILQIQYNLTDAEVIEYDSNHQLKNTSEARFGKRSWRQCCIDLSIDMKKQFGQDYFGRHLMDRILKTQINKNIIVSDGGFDEEIEPIIKEFGASNVHVIRIERDGFTYQGDSRKYLDAVKLGAVQHVIENKNLDTYLKCGITLILNILEGQDEEKAPIQAIK